jgi:hypothetical protein
MISDNILPYGILYKILSNEKGFRNAITESSALHLEHKCVEQP